MVVQRPTSLDLSSTLTERDIITRIGNMAPNNQGFVQLTNEVNEQF